MSDLIFHRSIAGTSAVSHRSGEAYEAHEKHQKHDKEVLLSWGQLLPTRTVDQPNDERRDEKRSQQVSNQVACSLCIEDASRPVHGLSVGDANNHQPSQNSA